MPKLEDFTICLVTASDEGYKAAKCILDDAYDVPKEISPGDGGVYGLGRVGRHNVVIAAAAHEFGTSPIAHVVRRLMQIFTSVRVGLLVGVGSGVPSQAHDIRLGDVIVGGALIQSDFTTAVQRGSKNIPPASLQTVINRLRFDESEGQHINETISHLQKQPRSRNMSKRPGQKSDRLFHPHINHPETGKTCEAVCTGNPQNLVNRPERATNDPIVHHGPIASVGNNMRDARSRDRIADKSKIICFETEAAGLMDHFPCAVIRGVCDYADSHGDSYYWRRYAAVTAAAYAKRLLLKLAPSAIEAEKRICDVFFEIEDILSVKSLKLEHVQKPKRFFKQGRVFAMVWVEPYLERQRGNQSNLSHPKDQAFSEIRLFIVIRQSYHASWCVPIHTYGGQGVHKQDIRIEDHAKIYRYGNEPPLSIENIPLKEPLPIVIEGSGDVKRLHPASLVNFGKIYTVEYGARVMNIGFVHRSHGPRLELNWKVPISDESNMTNTETRGKEQELSKTKLQPNQRGDDSERIVKLEQDRPGGQEIVMQDYDVSAQLDFTNKSVDSENTNTNEQIPSSVDDSIMQNDQLSRYQGEAELQPETTLPDLEPEYEESNETPGISSSRERNGLYQSEVHISKTWVCPFYRLDPGRYSKCNKSKMKEFRHVVQHLERQHTLPDNYYYCPRCWLSKNQAKGFEDHVKECHSKLTREYFYQSEMRNLQLEVKGPKQKLRDKLKGSLPDDLDDDRYKWFYVWRTHFSDDVDVSPYAQNLISDVLVFVRQLNKKLLQQKGSSSQLDLAAVLDWASSPPSRSWIPHPEDPNASVDQNTETQTGWTESIDTRWSPSEQSLPSLQDSQDITQKYYNRKRRGQDDRMAFGPEVDKIWTKRLREVRSGLLEFSYNRARAWMECRRYCVPPADKRPNKQATTTEEGNSSCYQEENSDEVVLYHLSYYHLACPFYAFDPERYKQCLLQHDFLSMEHVTQHLKKHHPEPPYCPVCGEKFLRGAQRDIHVRARACRLSFNGDMEEIDANQKMPLLQAGGSETTSEASQWQLEYEKALPGSRTHRTPYLEGPMEVAVSKIRDYWSKHSHECTLDYLTTYCQDDQDDRVDQNEIDNMGIDFNSVILGDLIERVVEDFAKNQRIVKGLMGQDFQLFTPKAKGHCP